MSTPFGSALLAGTVAGITAAVVNGLIFATGVIDKSVETPAGGPIVLGAVLVFSLIPNIVGGGVFWALQGRVSAPLRAWQIIVAVVTAVSFVTILGLESAPASMLIALIAMHVVAGAAAFVITPAVATRQAA